jgi:hypothetical protein
MINQLKVTVVPVLRQLQFTGSFPHFRRLSSDRINLLTFQFDRNGGGFVIEIANCKPEGFNSYIGNIDPHKVSAHDLSQRMRIQSNMKSTDSLTDDWFRYDKKYIFGLGNIYKKVCRDVLSKLDIALDYWQNGEIN